MYVNNIASKLMNRDNKNSIKTCGRIKCIQSKDRHKDRQKKYF